MLDFAIFAVTFVVILVGAVLYLYPVSHRGSLPQPNARLASVALATFSRKTVRLLLICSPVRGNI